MGTGMCPKGVICIIILFIIYYYLILINVLLYYTTRMDIQICRYTGSRAYERMAVWGSTEWGIGMGYGTAE